MPSRAARFLPLSQGVMMKKPVFRTKGPLLATSALVGVSLALALAAPRTARAADAAAPVTADVPVEEIIVRGRFIPDVMRETAEVATVLIPEDLARQGDATA